MNAFDAVVERAKSNKSPKRAAVAGAEDEHAIEAVFAAADAGIIRPVLVGDALRITEIIKALGISANSPDIIDVGSAEPDACAQRAVEVVSEGRADFLIKGRLETKDILKPVVDHKNNLRLDDAGSVKHVMSHLAFFQIPEREKLLVVTDGGMVMYPDLEAKKAILVNAVRTLRKMGIDRPKIAVLCAVERVNEKMPETLDARALAEAAACGEIADCVVEGPISYDIAMSAACARIKGYNSPWCGSFDVLLVPNITAGNILGKSLAITAHATMAGVVVGAKVPIVVTSRSADASEKFYSIALCASMS
ncbi:MAG: phosphate butyryltransferase [Synergistaceae bacterium]|jgi:phosphate butyryltransferase|nr:phosphate butyryltransferase [Synergistaceae bacterium]